MRTFLALLLAAPPALGADAPDDGAPAEEAPILLNAEDLAWMPAPDALPAGAEIAVLEGDPTAAGVFTMRLRLPADYRLDTHVHGSDERVTVLSGALVVGLGDEADAGEVVRLTAGGFMVMPPGVEHFAWTDEETILQITTDGPWEIEFLDVSG